MNETVNTVHQDSVARDVDYTRRVVAIGCVVIAVVLVVVGLLL